MAEDLFLQGVQNIGYLMNVIAIPLATILIGRKLLKEKKVTGKLNDIRALIFFIFFSFSNLVILEFLVGTQFYSSPLLAELFGGNLDGFNIYLMVIGLIASLGLMMVAAANRWDFLHYTSLFFFGGMVLLYLFTGFESFLTPYIYFAGGTSIVFLYFTGFRVKDNGALALAIFFTVAFGSAIFENAMATSISVIIYDIFVLVFSFGLFKPFKQEVIQ